MIIQIHSNNIDFPSAGVSFPINTGVSIAANMREALKEVLPSDGQQPSADCQQATIFVDTPAIIVPEEQLQYEDTDELYRLTMSGNGDEDTLVIQRSIDSLHIVALFAVAKDLKTVMEDNFKKFEFQHVALPSLQESAEAKKQEGANVISLARTLSVFFYDRSFYAYAFDSMGRLAFFNSFSAGNTSDRAYALLGVWKQLSLNQMKDELFLSGDVPEKDSLLAILHDFIQKVTCA